MYSNLPPSLSLSYIEHIYLDVDSSVVLRIKKVLMGTDKDVMFIFTYLLPYGSSCWKLTPHSYHMETTEQCVMDVNDITDDFYLLLRGDLNARTASKNYNQVQDNEEDVLSKVAKSFHRNHMMSVILLSALHRLVSV